MAISFNNIPTTIRTPGVYTEVDDSRALKGLVQNPHKALLIGQRVSVGAGAGTIEPDILTAITSDNLADGYFGLGSPLARMCNVFKDNNPNTELYAIVLSETGTYQEASCNIDFSRALDEASTASASQAGTWYCMINGEKCYLDIAVDDGAGSVAAAFVALINSNDNLPCHAVVSVAGSGGHVILSAKYSGVAGNEIDIRDNYFDGQVIPSCFSTSPRMSDSGDALSFTGGGGAIDLDSAWAAIADDQFHYIIEPAADTTNLTALKTELADRFLPLNDLQGHGITARRADITSLGVLGNATNSPHVTIMGAEGFPGAPEEWAAALGAVAAQNLNIDPARPLHFLKLKGLLPPRPELRFDRAERDTLLYDGIATHIVDSGGNVLIERCITTYTQTALNTLDPTWLDIQTLFTLMEIRYQYKLRMQTRFLLPRFKLADDTFPVQPGSKVCTPSMVKQETIALFSALRDAGIIENLQEFIDGLVVERNTIDVNRVDVLLPADLINAFRILAAQIQFIL